MAVPFFSALTPDQMLSIALADPRGTFSYVRTQQNAITVTVTFSAVLPDGKPATRTANIVVRTHSEHYHAVLARLFL